MDKLVQLTELLSKAESLKPFLGWLGLFSLFTFTMSLVLIPWIVGNLPEDCFLRMIKGSRTHRQFSVSSLILSILRICLGFLLLLAGILMLFLPGQGLLTIFLAALLLPFPGKQQLIAMLVLKPSIQSSLDWLRIKRGKSPFLWPASQNDKVN